MVLRVACRYGWLGMLALGLCALPAAAELQFKEGHWRLELNNAFGIDSGSKDRDGDWMLTGIAEYEFPATSRCTLGLRLLPLFIYDQDEDYGWWEKCRSEADLDSDTVWGAGAGLSFRIYQVKEEYRGLFAELSTAAMVHKNKINGNSSSLNFLSGIGVGYKFRNQWHAQIKWEHLSNAGLASHNPGANTIGLGIGYSF